MNATVKLGIVSFLCALVILALIGTGYLYVRHRQAPKYEGAWKAYKSSRESHEETAQLNVIITISKVDDVRYTVEPVENDGDRRKETWVAIKRKDGLLTLNDGYGAPQEMSIESSTGHLFIKGTDPKYPYWLEFERY
ncbi:MAG: hypothetical protein ACYDBB_26095 [Armatimonadota bacterium]